MAIGARAARGLGVIRSSVPSRPIRCSFRNTRWRSRREGYAFSEVKPLDRRAVMADRVAAHGATPASRWTARHARVVRRGMRAANRRQAGNALDTSPCVETGLKITILYLCSGRPVRLDVLK